MKSKQEHIQDGTYQKCRHEDRGTPVPTIQSLACPRSLKTKQIKELWNMQVGALCQNGLVTIVDAPELEHGFYCYMKAMECRAKLETFKDATEYYATLKFHEKDITMEYRRWMHEYEKVLYKFGMTPVEASRVRGKVKTEGTDDDILRGLIAAGS